MRPVLFVALVVFVAACEQPRREPEPEPDAGSIPDAGASPDGGEEPTCGNGRLDPNEACDPEIGAGAGRCPTACDDGIACTTDTLVGTAEACSARCTSTPLSACVSGDGCCPTGCTSSDGDCEQCTDDCAVNAKRCANGGTSSCGQFDGDSCLEWGSPAPCRAGETCNAGVCATTCVSDCTSAGATRCDGTAVVTCTEVSAGCLKWSGRQVCPESTVCSNGACAASCSDECAAEGERRCVAASANTWEVCRHHDVDDCLEWGSATACAGTLSCVDGECLPTCADTCPSTGAHSCAGDAVRTCGDWNSDGCREWGTETACNASDVCREGACVPRPAPTSLVINELLYDSTGSPDTGAFVELRGTPGTSLTGVTLIGVNGNAGVSGGPDYNAIALTGTIGTDGLFVIAHANAPPLLLAAADQRDSRVDYQNGPDSVQLRFGATVLDAVAYGSFGTGEVPAGEGQPAAAVSVGKSLGRNGSGTDTGNNAADFVSYDNPTPGAPNGTPCVPESDAALCARLGKNCGSVTAADNCGQQRPVASCGTCTSGSCIEGVCGAGCGGVGQGCANDGDCCDGVCEGPPFRCGPTNVGESCSPYYPVTFTGDHFEHRSTLEGRRANLRTGCTGTALVSKDVVYGLGVTRERNVRFHVVAPGMWPDLGLSTLCTESSFVPASCSPPAEHEAWLDARLNAGGHYLTVSSSDTPGPYTVTGQLYDVPANDSCSDNPAPLFPGGITQPTTIQGDTEPANNEFLDGPDLVYDFTTGTAKSLALSIRTPGWAPQVLLRDFSCGNQIGAGQVVAEESATSGELVLRVPSIGEGDYWLFVGGAGPGEFGTFTLDAKLAAPVASGEICQSGRTLDLSSGSATDADTTRGSGHQGTGTCGGGGEDRQYDFTLATAKDVTIRVTPVGNALAPAVHLRSSCLTSGSQVACASAAKGEAVTITRRLAAGTWSLWVDSVDAASAGMYRLEVTAAN